MQKILSFISNAILAALAFFASFLALLFVGVAIWGTADNTTLFPDWYTIAVALSPFLFAILIFKRKHIIGMLKNKGASAAPAQPHRKVPRSRKKRENMASDLLARASVSASLASKAVHVSTFLEEWDTLIETLTELIAYEGKVRFKSGTPSADVRKLNSEFQWKLRDAIEREKDYVISEITGKYRNSKEHKERCYQWFCEDIEEATPRFSQETLEFAEDAIRVVRAATGISRITHALRAENLASDNYSDSEAKLLAVDLMEGHEFEFWCADLLEQKGFHDVEVTPGSGDQGVDIIATKDGIRYAIQCKCYSNDLGNTPIQEVHAGKSMYRCQVGAVITNRHFTTGGKELAKATGVLLWDRDWIRNALEESSRPKLDSLIAEAESKVVSRKSSSSKPPVRKHGEISH